MVRDDEKQLIRECIDALREGIPGFKSRRPQMEMIAAVANTLSRCRAEDEQAGNGNHLAIVEAGTGTGKSFGALVPALPMFLVPSGWIVQASMIASAIGLFALGAAIAVFTGKNVLWSGARQLLIGMAAAGVTFGIGHLFGVAVA